MAAATFPNSPVNGDTVVINATTYVYNSTNNSWDIPVGAGLTLPLTSLSVGTEGTPSGDGELSYNNTTGVFTYTPPVISGGITTYNTIASLPLSNNNQGDLAYVSENNRLYIWNGSGWYNIALINTAPSITSGGAGNYYLETDGTPTVITLSAEDPEEVPITWSYAITSGSLGSTATINQADNVFTITPSVNQADEGQFSITFTASDGVNIATEINSFTLVFSKAEGGTQTIIDVSGVSYILHEFTSNGVFNLNTDLEVEYVLVGGGGAGGSGEASALGDGGGGGGAGGVLIGTQTLTAGSYTVTIGQGGQASRYHTHPIGDGGDTSLVGPTTLTAFGGGSGGHESLFGQNGGSSGGAGGICSVATGSGSLEGVNQGNKGGERPGYTECGTYRGGAGGGGAGSAGTANLNTGGAGGAGITTNITGINQSIAAGGGGGRGASNAQSINGGTGGGGQGGNGALTETHGSTYGSAGGGGSSGGFDGGIGYQGVVWIRYVR